MSEPLNREAILARRPGSQSLTLSDGAVVNVRGMTGAERDAFETSLMVGEGKEARRDVSNFRARVVVRCLVDQDGKRLFSDADADLLGEISGTDLDELCTVAARLSGIGAGDLEKAAKN